MLGTRYHTGIYLTRTHAYWALIATQRHGHVIDNHCYHHALSDSESLLAFVNHLDQQHPHHQHKPHVMLASEWYLLKIIAMDKRVNPNEFTRYLEQQAVHEFNVPYDDLLIDYQRLPTLKHQPDSTYVIAACQQSTLAPIITSVSPQREAQSITIDALGVHACYNNNKRQRRLISLYADQSVCILTIVHNKRITHCHRFDLSQDSHHTIELIGDAIQTSIEAHPKKPCQMAVLLGPHVDFLLSLQQHFISIWPEMLIELASDKTDAWNLASTHQSNHGLATLAALKGQWHALD